MKKTIMLALAATGTLVGCETLFEPTVDSFLDRKDNGYILKKENDDLLDGPFKIVTRVTADSMIVEKDKVQYMLKLRGCERFGVIFENRVKHSYFEDMGVYLLRDSVVNVSSNEIKAVVYRPANQVYVGGTKGFDNLTYVMPQVLHIANGELRVDHSDTNFPLHKVFAEAERLAQKKRNGYWATHSGPSDEVTTNKVLRQMVR